LFDGERALVPVGSQPQVPAMTSVMCRAIGVDDGDDRCPIACGA